MSTRFGKRLKSVWVIVASLWLAATCCILIYGAIANVRLIDNKFGDGIVEYATFWSDKSLINPKTGEKVVKQLDWIVEVPKGDSITVYSSGGRRGYVNVRTGELLTGPIFDKAWTFSEGLGAASINGSIMFIGTKGQLAIDRTFTQCHNDTRFRNGYCIIGAPSGFDGNVGIIDKAGNWIVEPVYCNIISKYEEANWYEAYDWETRSDIKIRDEEHEVSIYPSSIKFFGDTIMTKEGEQWEYYIKQKIHK